MGSLMGGWDSPVLDPITVELERNKSETKEEIDAYWSSKKKPEEEHLIDISAIVMNSNQDGLAKEPEGSPPLSNAKDQSLLEMETETSLEQFPKKTGWWTRTNSAFLNKSPVIATEDPT